MKPTELYDNISGDKDFRGALVGKGLDACAIITHKPTGLTTRIPMKSIYDLTWDVVQAVLKGLREPVVLTHMTRVVGYYSFTHNWNGSKIGELHDRHLGNYALPEAKPAVQHFEYDSDPATPVRGLPRLVAVYDDVQELALV